jgi:ABC-2 type transport system permease protein
MRATAAMYFRLVRASLRSLMQYRFSFMFSLVVNVLVTVADFLVVLAILYNFRSIGGWNTAQIAALYGVATAALGIYRAFGSELQNFQNYIVTGEFDGLLLRPWPTLLVLLSRRVELFRLGAVLQGYAALVISLAYLGGPAEFGVAYFYMLLLPLLSSGIFFAISIATAAVAFWTGRIRELQTFTIYGPSTAASYPTAIYPRWIRYFLTVLPVTFVGYVPLRTTLGLGGQLWHVVTPMVASAISLLAALWLWRRGERAYHSTGS